jgi:3-oxoadipate enol-lactonase
MSEDILDQIQTITMPILILAAEKDLVEPVNRVQRLVYETLPTSKIKIIKGSGHLSPVECPELVASELRDFIRER